MPSLLTHFPSSCAGPGGSPELGAARQAAGPPPSPSLSSDAVDRANELRISIARPPRCEMVLLTVLASCTMARGCAPWKTSHQPINCRPAPPVPHRALYASPRSPCAPCGRRHGTSTCCIMGCTPSPLGRTGHTHCASGPVARVSARGQFFNGHPFLFSYLDIHSSKNYEISFVGFIIYDLSNKIN
jgi:hypothetical protein